MDEEINFCPYCSAPQHKIMLINNIYFCRECSRFFKLSNEKFSCPNCNNTKIEKSDFPSPNGDLVFQCKKCRKMFSASSMFEVNQ